jgi:acetylornithine deacetylase
MASRFWIRRPGTHEARERDEAGVSEIRIDEGRLVDWASRAIATPSFTGSEEAMAELMRETFLDLGLQVQWQQVEEGRANVLGTLPGSGGGPSLMFNGHLDTSYSGREPWLRHVPGFQPSAFVEDGRLYGLGISNMKGALACYVEALRALADGRVRLRGDVLVAAVSGEIEKAQWGDAQGAEYRGYAAGSRYLVSHGGVADMCVLGEPTESKVVLGHFGSLWLRISTRGPFVHTAFSEGKRDENAIVRLRDVLDAVLEWIPTWEGDPENAYRGAKAIVNVGAVEGGFGWRVSRTPHRADLFLDVRVPPTKEMATARGQVLDLVRDLAERFPEHGIEGEVYVTAPGAEIAEEHPLVGALDEAHAEVFGAAPERDVTRWFSDASVLTRYGIATVNYGTSTGLLDTVKGENLEIDGLVKTAEVYARVAMKVCGVA